MGSSANFAATPRSEVVDISAANTNRDGTGTIVAGFAPGASGSRVDRIEIKATGTTVTGMVRVFKKKGAGGWKLWREYSVSAAVPSSSVQSFSALDDDIGEVLDATTQIGFATHNAEAFVVSISGGDF